MLRDRWSAISKQTTRILSGAGGAAETSGRGPGEAVGGGGDMAPSACGGINSRFAVACVVLWFVFLFVYFLLSSLKNCHDYPLAFSRAD